jgi:hypothetical protein
VLLGLVRERWKRLRAWRFLTDEYAESEQRFGFRSGDANWPVFRRHVLAQPDSPGRRDWLGFAQAEDVRVRSQSARRSSAMIVAGRPA